MNATVGRTSERMRATSVFSAVMTRATRGHTGRPLKADRATIFIYILAHSGALLRVIAPLLPFDYLAVIALAGALWAAAFLLFLIAYVPMAVRRAPAV